MTNQNQSRNITQHHAGGVEDTLIGAAPVGVIFNLTQDDFNDFIGNYFKADKGIGNFYGTRTVVEAATKDSNRLKVVAFFSVDNKHLTSSTSGIPDYISRQMDSANYRASNDLYSALKPLVVYDGVRFQQVDKNLVGIQLDEFRVLGMMLAARRNEHDLQIIGVNQMKKSHFVASVMKMRRFNSPTPVNGDKLADLSYRVGR